ncbi:response regulator transcription factor [Prolixibacteraceae bacterium JC049]|nr:response regulator transcription factor [Prolixibacteraceae bacterium JC049]
MDIKCLIIDDDAMARRALKRLCDQVDGLEVVDLAENGQQGIELIEKHNPDLIFLDVEMPDFTGIEMLSKLPVIPAVIFTTSKKEYAFDAFQYEAIAYLVKPIIQIDFKRAVQKAFEAIAKDPTASANDFFIRTNKKYVKVSQENIYYFENVGDYIKVVTTGKSHILYGTMKDLLEKLNKDRFIKIHRSYIVNINHIQDLDENSVLVKEKVLPVSRSNRPELMSRLQTL